MAPLHRFEAVEELETQLRAVGLDLRLLQLSNGNLSGHLVTRQLGPLRLLRLQVNRCLHVHGGKPRDQRLIALNLLSGFNVPPLRAHGAAIGADALFGLDPLADVHLSTPERMDLAVVMVNPGMLTRWSSDQGSLDLESAPFRFNVLPIAAASRTPLQRWLLPLLSIQPQTPSDLAPSPSGLEDWDAGLFPLLVDVLEQGLRGQGWPDCSATIR
jgi:AraC family transcriptional regulator, ethanolamine operon transcriptional activator